MIHALARGAVGTLLDFLSTKEVILAEAALAVRLALLNEITEIEPGELGNLLSLRYLYLSGNKIAKLKTGTVSDMPNLQTLNLENNEIAEIEPGAVSNMPSLQYLSLSGNPGVPFACPTVSQQSSGCEMNRASNCGSCTFWVDGLRGWMLFKTGGPCMCSSLSLYNKGIAKIANGTWNDLQNLQTLNLQNNEITEIEPGELGNLLSLRYLHLSGNKIAKLKTGTVSDMPNLQTLNLENNEIAEIEPGAMSNVPSLQYLSLSGNPGVPFACPTVSQQSSGCEMNRVQDCGGCTFWVDGLRGWMLFKTGECAASCTGLWLENLHIRFVANGTFDDITNLQQLYVWNNFLGCVPGVGPDVEIDRYYTQKTPRCPSNCTTGTYYLSSDNGGICLNCPDGSHTLGIGAAGIDNCTYPLVTTTTGVTTTTTPTPTTTSSAATTTPAAFCDETTSPFILAGDTLCVPNHLFPAPNVAHCVFENMWEDVVENKHLYNIGGLGKKMRDMWQVWVCMEHPCATDKNDRVCFTFSEAHRVFVPLGYNSRLRILKK